MHAEYYYYHVARDPCKRLVATLPAETEVKAGGVAVSERDVAVDEC